jgi:hypothetical protein
MRLMGKRDEFLEGVKAILAHRAGFRCSKPSCRAHTAGPSDETPDAKSNVGVAAHITAAAEGGARYDERMSTEERRSVTNGIWMCQIHGKEVDDDAVRFPRELLETWKRHAEEDARAMLGRPISAQSLDVLVQLALHRAEDDSLLATGVTNLPDGTKLWVELVSSPGGKQLGTAKSIVSKGMFGGSGFTNQGAPHPHGWYTVEALAYFNGPWEQPDAVLDIVGREGAYLVGRFADPLHPEFEESEKRLRAGFECVAPQLTAAPRRTAADCSHAIEIVKGAILTVRDKGRSADPVGKVVEMFMSSVGIRTRNGWWARALPDGSILVRYSYWSGGREAEAEWIVILDTGEVRYRNLDAKYMSWAPHH